MSKSEKAEIYICVDCSAELSPRAARCWRCKRVFSQGWPENEVLAITEEELRALDKSANSEVKKASVPLKIASSIILTIVSGLVLTSIFLMAPGLGLLLTILAAPAMIGIFSKSEGGNRSSVLKTVLTFLAVAGLGVILTLCLIVALFISCIVMLKT
jgi:DNA-directed RNA polymerase subunit RPC12/RpoP